MAEVDFSNAIIEPEGISVSGHTMTENPTSSSNVNLPATYLVNASGTNIANCTVTRLINEQKQLVYSYTGTFTAGGTVFYVNSTPIEYDGAAWWKITNIVFSSGDTFGFTINATLTCN